MEKKEDIPDWIKTNYSDKINKIFNFLKNNVVKSIWKDEKDNNQNNVIIDLKNNIIIDLINFSIYIENIDFDLNKIQSFKDYHFIYINNINKWNIKSKLNYKRTDKKFSLESITIFFEEYSKYELFIFDELKDVISNINKINTSNSVLNSTNIDKIKIIDNFFINKKTDGEYIYFETTSFIGKSYIGDIGKNKIKLFFQINPKIDNASVMRMINEAYNTRIITYDHKINNYENLDFSNIYFLVYLNKLDEFVLKHLRRDYIKVNNDLSTIKGKIDIKNSLKNIIKNREYIVHCNYFDLSIDSLINQILKEALLKTGYYSNFGSELFSNYIRGKFNKLISYFNGIKNKKITKRDLENINLNNPIYKNYIDVFPIAKNILEKTSVSLNQIDSSIEKGGLSFFLDMNILFEDYVTGMLLNNQELKQNGIKVYTENRLKYKYSDEYIASYNNEEIFKIKPDIILKKENKIMIIDTKYKCLNENIKENFGISSSDIYQIMTYLQIYKSSTGILIYPSINDIPKQIDFVHFENDIINKFTNEEDKKLFINSYDKDNNKKLYILKNSIEDNIINQIRDKLKLIEFKNNKTFKLKTKGQKIIILPFPLNDSDNLKGFVNQTLTQVFGVKSCKSF